MPPLAAPTKTPLPSPDGEDVGIDLEGVGLELPVYDIRARSLKLNLMKIGRRGRLEANAHHLTVRVLHGLNLSLRAGDRLGLLGVNGAGKSTLLRVLAGIYAPTEGRITTRGRVVPLLDIALGMDEHSTGRQNIMLRGLLLGMTRRDIEERIEGIARFSELGEYLELPLRTYSSGMKLRLAFAISTAVDADILLLDEVVGVGDQGFQAKAKARLEELQRRSKIVVLAIHSHEVVREWCNKALWLEGGEIRASGTSAEVTRLYQMSA